MSTPCPFCGAYGPRACELEDEEAGIECAWDEGEPDPDYRRGTRDDMRRLWPLEPDDGRGDYLYDLRRDR